MFIKRVHERYQVAAADKEKDKKPLGRKEAQANLERRLRETLYSKDFNADELRAALLPEFQENGARTTANINKIIS